jgi:hypothetical protein
MRIRTVIIGALVLAASLFGGGSMVSPANAAVGCGTAVQVLPSLNPSYPGVNINVCINEFGLNAEVGLVPGVDLNALFAGLQASAVCVYSPVSGCALLGVYGVDVDPPAPGSVFSGPFGPGGDPCIGSNCLSIYLSGNTGVIHVYAGGTSPKVSIPLNIICVRYRNSTPC